MQNNDLISRSAAIDALMDALCMTGYQSRAIDAVRCLPTIDAEPVRHGRWEWYEDWGPSTWLEPPDLDKAGWKCSNCGIDLGDYLTDCLGVDVYVGEEDKMPKIKSCQNCGSKMDAKEA